MSTYQIEGLRFIKEFQQGDITIPWERIAEDTDLQEELIEYLDDILHHVSLIREIEKEKKIRVGGALLVAHGDFVRMAQSDSATVAQWSAVGKECEHLLQQLFVPGSAWIGDIEGSFASLNTLEKKIEQNTITLEEFDQCLPALLLLSVYAFLMVDNDDEEE